MHKPRTISFKYATFRMNLEGSYKGFSNIETRIRIDNGLMLLC